MDKAEHLNMSVKKLQVSQDDFCDEVLREISQMNDEMQQLKLSHCQKIDSLPIRMNSNVATNNTNSDLARKYWSTCERNFDANSWQSGVSLTNSRNLYSVGHLHQC